MNTTAPANQPAVRLPRFRVLRGCINSTARFSPALNRAVAGDTSRHLLGELGWQHLKTSEADLQLGTLIGTGSYGIVREAEYRGLKVAVKVVKKKRGNQGRGKVLRKLAREIDLLTKLQDCCNIIQLITVLEDNDHAYLVCELCSGGDLERLLVERGPLSERVAAKIVYEALKMLATCHANNVIHGDVKPANFLLRQKHADTIAFLENSSPSGAWLKSIDFGCSQVVRKDERLIRRTGTPVYMAPEIFERSYSVEADLWSVGMMFYQMMASRFPFWTTLEECHGKSVSEVSRTVLHGNIPLDYGPWLSMSPEGLDLMKKLTERRPELRISAAKALEHDWFKRQLNSAPPALPQRSNIIPRAAKPRKAAVPAAQEEEPPRDAQPLHPGSALRPTFCAPALVPL